MATRPDFKVTIEDIDPHEAVVALQRVHSQYTKAEETGQPFVLVHHIDLAHVIVLAALFVEEGP